MPKKRTSSKYQIIKWARTDVPCEHGPVTYREALDLQIELTKKEGAQSPEYIYTIEGTS